MLQTHLDAVRQGKQTNGYIAFLSRSRQGEERDNTAEPDAQDYLSLWHEQSGAWKGGRIIYCLEGSEEFRSGHVKQNGASRNLAIPLEDSSLVCATSDQR